MSFLGESGLPATAVEVEEQHSGAPQVVEHDDEMGMEKDDRLEKGEEVEQQLHTVEEVEEHPATNTPEVEKVDMDHTAQAIEECTAMELEENPDVGVNPTEGVEIGPVEGAERNTTVPEREEVVVVSDGEEGAEKVSPSVEDDKQEVATVRTYQRRPAREEALEKGSEGEQLRETSRQEVKRNEESPARSRTEAPRRRRRLLMDKTLEAEEENTVFPRIGGSRSQRNPMNDESLLQRVMKFGLPVEEVADSERERGERKRKGKAIATPVRKEVETTIIGCSYSREGPQ